jgi:2-polyprenyl-6-methoxyphenol hydroxylase-like FAD-dependent oxidoreductase
MKRRILISGGGIAGLTAARLLFNQGHDITVIDRAKQFNKAGFLVSLKSFGVEIMEELGLTKALHEESTPSEFMEWANADGTMIRSISYRKVNQNISQSILIARGGLHEVLYNNIKSEIPVMFNTTIKDLQQEQQKVNITLSNGDLIEADLVIVSEGLRSSTRTKYFQNSQLEDFNLLYMGGRIKDAHSYPLGTIRTYLDIRKMLSIYPVSKEEIAIQCYLYNTDELSNIHADAPKLLKETFKEYNTEVKLLINRFLEGGLMFADKMGMVHTSNLVNDKIVLLGDAGYCPTALSGMGASLSIYGAKALAHFLNQSPDDVNEALQSYNSLMQPLVGKFQGNARNNAKSFIPDNDAELKRFTHLFGTVTEDEVSKMMTDQLVLTENQLNFIPNEQ